MTLAVVVAGIGGGISPAGAVVTSYNSLASGDGGGDIFIGFQATNSPGNTYSYLVKLTTKDFLLGLTEAYTFNVGNILADLSQDVGGQGFGPDWSSRADLYWGVFGASVVGASNASSVYFGSRARIDPEVQSEAWLPLTSTAHRTGKTGPITGVGGLYSGKESTANSIYAIWQSTSLSGGYAEWAPVSSANAFNNGTSIGWTGYDEINGGYQVSFANGTAGAVLDFYQVGSVANTKYLGYFTINDNAEITFTPVPEPTVAAFLAFGGVFSLVARRRRSSALQTA